LGKGEGALRYLRLGEHCDTASDGGVQQRVLFGGGYTSVLHKDGWLIVGCNPRSMRRVLRGVTRSLADRRDFAATWDSSAPIIGYGNIEPLAETRNAFTELVAPVLVKLPPLFFAAADRRLGPGMPLQLGYSASDLRKFLRIVRPVTVTGAAVEDGLVLELEGSAMFSPCAWVAALTPLGFEIGRYRLR
jgi:hypothetical protein